MNQAYYNRPKKWLRFFVIIVLVLGIFFRFVNLDKKVYWEDETYTSLWVAGYDWNIDAKIYHGQIISSKELLKYQQITPEKNIGDTLKALKINSEHPPLYYLIARLWAQVFGTSVTAMRSLPALISLLVFPCIYWLCLELFESSTVGWIAVALVAVSPIFVRYAQEARQYSMWTVTILLSSAVLVRALRLKTKLNWIVYSATVAVSLYTHVFSGFVLIGHGIYVATISRFRLNKRVTAYLLASTIGFATFMPWLLVIFTNRPFTLSRSGHFASGQIAVIHLIKGYLFNIKKYLLYCQ